MSSSRTARAYQHSHRCTCTCRPQTAHWLSVEALAQPGSFTAISEQQKQMDVTMTLNRPLMFPLSHVKICESDRTIEWGRFHPGSEEILEIGGKKLFIGYVCLYGSTTSSAGSPHIKSDEDDMHVQYLTKPKWVHPSHFCRYSIFSWDNTIEMRL